MPPPYRDWKQVHTFPYGTVVYDLDVSPDGTQLAASFGEISGQQSVRVLSIAGAASAATSRRWREFDFGTAVPNNFVFSPDGRFLYGSSYYTGVSNIFRYEIATKQLEAVSNTDTGFFRPIPLGGDELIVFRYTGEGFVPARITARPLQDISAITFLGRAPRRGAPGARRPGTSARRRRAVRRDARSRSGTYRLARRPAPESLYPIVQGYKDSGRGRRAVNFSDPPRSSTGCASPPLLAATDLPASERVHLAAAYDRFDWRARAR